MYWNGSSFRCTADKYCTSEKRRRGRSWDFKRKWCKDLTSCYHWRLRLGSEKRCGWSNWVYWDGNRDRRGGCRENQSSQLVCLSSQLIQFHSEQHVFVLKVSCPTSHFIFFYPSLITTSLCSIVVLSSTLPVSFVFHLILLPLWFVSDNHIISTTTASSWGWRWRIVTTVSWWAWLRFFTIVVVLLEEPLSGVIGCGSISIEV